MSNKLFRAVSTGLGVGLLAASLSAPANAVSQSWASGMIFYKGGATPTYVINVPTGNTGTDYTLVVELASTATNLNAFTIGYEFGALAATGAGEINKIAFAASNDVNSGSVSWVNSQGLATGFTLNNTASTNGFAGLQAIWGGLSQSWYVPGASSYSQSLSGNVAFGTGTAAVSCPYTMKATLALNGNFSIETATNSISVPMSQNFPNIKNFSTATSGANSFFFPLVSKTSGLAAADWTTIAMASLTVWDAQTNGSIGVPSSLAKVAYTATTASLGTAGTAASNPNWPSASGVDIFTKINTCNGVYANRTALNNSGLIIGGANGLSRIW